MKGNDKLGWAKIDWKTILVFVVLVFIGWLNIYAAVYNEALAGGFSLSSKYGMQLIWIGISTIAALVILLIDDIYYHQLAYPAYVVMLIVLLLTLVVGHKVNGARSWLVVGPISIQPAEFMKVATALSLARFMSEYNSRNPAELWEWE